MFELIEFFIDVHKLGKRTITHLEVQASLVEGGSLFNGNSQAVIGNGESLVLIFLALLSLGRLGACPFSHVWSYYDKIWKNMKNKIEILEF